jgi:hypothetical protein
MSWKDKGRPTGCQVYCPWDYRWLWNGQKRRNYYCWHRQPRTTQEMRFWDSEYGRRRRSPSRLPDYWDDVVRHVQRSWKEHRLTQYKPLD